MSSHIHTFVCICVAVYYVGSVSTWNSDHYSTLKTLEILEFVCVYVFVCLYVHQSNVVNEVFTKNLDEGELQYAFTE